MSASTPKALGEALRRRRKALGVSQKDLAMACGTGLRFISDLERGKPTCQIGKVFAVVRTLGLAMEAREP